MVYPRNRRFTKTVAALLAASALAAAPSTEPTTRPTSRATRVVLDTPADVRGVSWSDPRDNYQPGVIIPAHLKLDDTPEQAAEVTRRMIGYWRAMNVNVVRLGINPATVGDEKWWAVYDRIIRTLSDEGMGVLLCAWEQSPPVHLDNRRSHNGRYGGSNVDAYAAMWQTAHERLKDVPNIVGYELLNEPFGFRDRVDQYVADMRKMMRAIGPDLQGRRILVAGVGYSDDVQSLRNRFPEEHVWFAYHVYVNWFGGWGDNVIARKVYADGLARELNGLESRTIITEFGSWGSDAYDYTRPSDKQEGVNARQHVAYLQGIADTCASKNLGSIYWVANADARDDRRAYDLLNRDGTIHDADQFAEVQRAWRVKK